MKAPKTVLSDVECGVGMGGGDAQVPPASQRTGLEAKVTKVLIAGIVAICFVGLSAERAFAQQNTSFMLVPGIPGDSINEGYAGWIDVRSLTQSFDASAKNANVCSLAVIKYLDSAGPRLWAAAVTGQPFKQVQLDIVTQNERPTKLYEILLINARIAGIKTTVVFGESFEDLTIVAESISLKFFPQTGQPITASVSCR
jgi:type VI protein secretion system component Hcp